MASQREIENTAKKHGINLVTEEVQPGTFLYKFQNGSGYPILYTLKTGEAHAFVIGYLNGAGYSRPHLEDSE